MSCKSIRYQGKNGQSAGKDESKGKLYAGKGALWNGVTVNLEFKSIPFFYVDKIKTWNSQVLMSQDVTLATIILHKKMTSFLYTSTFMLLKSLVADFGGNVCLLMFLPPNQSLAPRPEKWHLKQGSLSWGSIQQAPLASALRWYETPGSWIMFKWSYLNPTLTPSGIICYQ